MIKAENRTKILFLSILTLFISGIIIYSIFNAPNPSTNSDDKIVVAASILPQKEFIEKVGGNRVQVIIMVPPGADPHTYEPEPSKLTELSRAKIYFEVGSGIEFELSWMDKIKSLNSQMQIINSSKGIKLISNQENANQSTNQTQNNIENEMDPHVWVSPRNTMQMVENIYQGLVKIDPDHKDYYLKNKENYLKELHDLDQDINQSLEGKKNTMILVYHPAWGYFCRDYGLQQIAIQQNGKEPSAQLITQIIDLSKKNNITAIFVSPQYSTRNAEVIANEIGAEIVVIDPLAPNYIQNMQKVLKAFQNS
jgi:zinc transport system substrate-binding protein